MVKKFHLKNGLKVLLVESHKSPVVSVQMWVKTGSADEQKGEEGISHFIEHLLFKGTEKFKVGEIASTVEGSGGELNAYTSFDQTVFYITISKEFSNTALDCISQMMGFPLFDETEIDNEREVVIEEIKRSNDSAHRKASQLLFTTNYAKHPYGRPVIGYDKVIKKVSRKTILNYFESRYVPRNMTLVVIGDFDSGEMKKKVENYFGKFRDFKLRKVSRKKEPKITKPKSVTAKESFEEAILYMSWPAPAVDHKDVAGLEVLSLILGQGDSSRLAKRLRLEKPLVNSISAGSFTPKDPGFLAISATLNVDNLGAALKEVGDEIIKLVAAPPTLSEIEKAVVSFESEEYYAMETVDGLARKYGGYENLFDDYRYVQTFLKLVRQQKPKDLQKIAKKYFTAQNMSVVLTAPSETKQTRATAQKWMKDFEKQLKAVKAQKVNEKGKSSGVLKRMAWAPAKKSSQGDNSITKVNLPSGARVLFRPNHDTPLVSVKSALLGGLRLEPAGHDGLTEILSRVWMGGTAKLSENEIYQKIDSVAGRVSTFGGRNTIGLQMDGLSGLIPDLYEVFREVLLAPTFNESIIERERNIMKEEVRTRNDNPAQIAVLNLMQKMFPEHPYGKDLLGSEKSLEKLGRAQILEHWKKMFSATNYTLVVAGDVKTSQWEKMLADLTAAMPKPVVAQPRFVHNFPKEDVRVFTELKKEQSHIVVGYKGISLDDPNRPVLHVMQSVLAGQGGRLFLELRDKASLAYSISPIHMEGIEAGYFGAYIGCSPEKGEKAISMMKEELSKLMQERVPLAELERAQKYLIGRHDIDLQKNSAVASSILFDDVYGIDYQETFRFAERIKAVTAEQVQGLAQRLFSALCRQCRRIGATLVSR